MRFLFAGGGTGGHLFPGLALAEALQEKDKASEIFFVGTKHGLDVEIVKQYPLEQIAAGRGSPLSWRRPLNAFRFAHALWQCRGVFQRRQPDLVVGLGGFAAAAPGLLARWQKVPLVLLEQNTVPGRVNRLLSRWAEKAYLQFKAAGAHLHCQTETSGSPLRRDLLKAISNSERKRNALLIIGGSQGAQRLNQVVVEAVKMVKGEIDLPVIHVAGARNEGEVRAHYGEVPVEVHGFCNDMATLYSSARLAISRAGAMSLAELGAAGVPALLVPLPSAKDNHQHKNADVIAAAGAAQVFDQNTLCADVLSKAIKNLWNDDATLSSMVKAMKETAMLDAAHAIADELLAMGGRHE